MRLKNVWNCLWHKGDIKTAFQTPTPQNIHNVTGIVADYRGMVSSSDKQRYKDLFLYAAVLGQSKDAVTEALNAGANPAFRVILAEARMHRHYPATGGRMTKEYIPEQSETAHEAAARLGNKDIAALLNQASPATAVKTPAPSLRALRAMGFEAT